LSKSFYEISSFLNTGLGFLDIGLNIAPKLLDRRMGNHESLEFKRLIASWQEAMSILALYIWAGIF
jgi:hypothetical protein